MHRYAAAPRSTFEELFEQARTGIVKLDGADYPPVCGGRSGEVSLALGRSGAMIVHVAPGECSADEFRLKLLFETGTCVFSTPQELCSFWTGPLAAAFGIEPANRDVPPVEAPCGEEDTVPPSDAGPSRPESMLADLGPGNDASPTGTTPPLRIAEADRAPQPERRLTVAQLAAELGRVIHGQEPALERIASAAVAQLKKRHPARPGSVLLIGPTGVGKTTAVEALPTALKALGFPDARVFRLDCGELGDSIQVTRLLGSPPGYSGHTPTTPLLTAIEHPGCILLVDELEKAHPDVFDLLLGLLDAGRVTSPNGKAVDARHIVVALTTNARSEELAGDLGRTQLEDRWAVQRACADHLRAVGLPTDLVGRIGSFAVFSELAGERARRGIAQAAIISLGREYGLVVEHIDTVVLEVTEDIAGDHGTAGGARALHHAARELLAESFGALAADGPRRRVEIVAGPPLEVRLTRARGAPSKGSQG